MCDEWMKGLKLTLSPHEFRTIPRHPDFHYTYLHGQAYITPRPNHCHAVLDLGVRATTPHRFRISPLKEENWNSLVGVFAAAFIRTPPFAALTDEERVTAAHSCLTRTREGGDGPLVPTACFEAYHGTQLVGGLLVTLLPDGKDPSHPDSYHWQELPPPDCAARGLGRPHLTWVFVTPDASNHRVATALLDQAIEALRRQGYTQLLTTFLLGNEASVLWHWRQGFRLLVSGNPTYRRRKPMGPDPESC